MTSAQRPGLVLAAMTLANAMILVDQTAVPLTLPDIMKDFGIGTQLAQWVLSGSLLSLAGLLVLGGRLGDLLGRRQVFIVGSTLFVGASVVAGFAPDIEVLLAARFVQGAGGALMLPVSVAIVSSTFSAEARGRALGTMGGVAAVAGALGPTIGGVLTSVISWRAVFLVNVPLAVACIVITLRSIPREQERAASRGRIDVVGAVLLFVALVGLVYGLGQTQGASVVSVEVLAPLAVSAAAAVVFWRWEARTTDPLMDFGLLRRHRNYLGATTSQALAGMVEMGVGVLFPVILIINLEMSPALAGLALIPTTIPMVLGAPLAGRWYDRVGGRPPLVVGFAALALSGVALAVAAGNGGNYLAMLPGFLLLGTGLALVLTVNDPVSLDLVPDRDHGQASGVAATAEQGGGAVGIAVLYAIFHVAYVGRLNKVVDTDSSLPDLTEKTGDELKAALQAAEQTGLNPSQFDPAVREYLLAAKEGSQFGYLVAFIAVAVLGVLGLVAAWLLVRKPPKPAIVQSVDDFSPAVDPATPSVRATADPGSPPEDLEPG